MSSPGPSVTGNEPPYVEVERGPNHSILQQVLPFTDERGKTAFLTNHYTALLTGVHHLVNGQWLDSSAQIQITATGGVGTNTQHQVFFPTDIAGGVNVQTPDGQHLIGRPAFLSYLDYSTGTNILLAEITNSTGTLVSSNTVIYPAAFTDVDIDVSYDYRIDGLEQNIVLKQQLSDPSEFGLSSQNVALQIYTEFLDNPHAPQITPLEPDIQNEFLDFGTMQMVQGKAFAVGDESNQVPTRKHWAVINQRHFLVEEIDFAALAPLMQNLPAPTPATDPNTSPIPIRHRFLPGNLPPKTLLAKGSSGGLKRANQSILKEKGLVLDYNLVTSSSNYVFAGDTTFLVTGSVNLTGTTTFESTVIKFSATNSPTLNCNGPVVCLSTDYRPLNFLAVDDNSLGETITGSTGMPTNNNYATVALNLTPGTNQITMRNLRFCNAKIALAVTGGPSNVFSHVQMVNCQNGVSATNTSFALRNALFNNVLTNFTGGSSTGRVEQVTVDTANWLNNNLGTNLYLTNCLLVAVTNAGTFSSNSVYSVTSPSGIFQSIGAGTHYLAVNSPYRGVGTTNINPILLAQLTNMTTYPPLLQTNTFTFATTLNPQVQRESGGAPDAGYHYDAMDYLSSCVVSNAVLSLTNGVVLGYYNSFGVNLRESSQLISQGTPNQKNCFAYFLLIQEQPINLLSQSNAVSGVLPINVSHTDLTQDPSASLRFTALSVPVGASYVWYTGDSDFAVRNLSLRDCEVYSSGSTWNMQEMTNVPVVLFVNNFFPRPAILVLSSAQVTTYNNLYTGATNDTALFINNGSASWTNKDNAYDAVDSYMDGSISNNAYLNGAFRESPLQSNDIVTNLTWVNGPLGNYYQPTNSPLINMGSTTADQLGLYHYTVLTNQVPETNSIVDIGYHYVALGANGLPADTVGSGVPDYLKDANGNGLVDSGEVNWTNAADLGLSVLITRPANNSVIP